MRFRTMLPLVAVAALAAGCGGSGGSGSASARASASAPARFAIQRSNQWFPLRPGTTWLYRGTKDGKPTRDVMTVTHATRTIQGVHCIVVSDKLYEKGRLEERTTDWYAADRDGNVWYFGEDTAELSPSGKVKSTEGTWRSGVNGARAGIYIPGNPRVGQSGLQEYYRGHAEDHYRVKTFSARVKTPAVSTSHALMTEEWTPLEPAVLDHKLYVRGVGVALEQSVKGPLEVNRLVSFKRG